ncbi:MAG: S8 family serine peptidase [Actinomycetota bacterium]
MKALRILALLLFMATVAPFVPATAGSSDTGRYVVSLKRDRDPEASARQHETRYGAKPDRYFHSAIKGYSATIPSDRVAALRADPSVISVTKNYAFHAAAQTTPIGVSRIGALDVPGTGEGVQVAVLDSGIDYNHPDLAANVLGGVDCDAPYTGNYLDGQGHGTHVAGILAAIDNTIGVVGVAPKAKLWAVRILDQNGAGDLTSILCGLDWVDARSPANGGLIQIANMSIEAAITNADDGNCGFSDGDPVHQAICSIVGHGVTFTVAAGNHTDNIKDVAPAAYDEVITVTALVDYEGAPCSLAADPQGFEADDTFAEFSSYATTVNDRLHTIGAPGAYEILSTFPGGTYALNYGTSMASPHVAGAIARYLQTHPGTSPAGVLEVIQDIGEPKDVDFNDECPGTTASHTDPSGLHLEPVVRVADWELEIQVATPGIVRGNKWYLNNGFDGAADIVFTYGSSTDKIVVGDWDGDGIDTPGIVRGNVWYLNDGFDPYAEYVFNYGSSTDRPIVGDWDDDGDDTPGVVRGNVWYLNNDHDPTSNVPAFAYGSATDRIIAGDWNGDGEDTPGIIRGNVWYLNDNFDPNAYKVFGFGSTTDASVAGDWVGDGIDRPGLHRSNKYYLNLGFDSTAEIVFPYGIVSDRFVVGDWDGENP